MKKHTLTVAMLAVATLGWISTASAQAPEGQRMRHPGGPGFGPGGHDGPGAPGERVAEHLGLSDEQKTQWKAIHEKAREEGEPLMKAAGEAKRAFDQALESDNADAAAIGQAAINMRNAHRSLEAQHKATAEAVKAILTPEQAAKFDEMQKHMRGPGPGGPEGQGMRKREKPGESR